MHTCSVARKLEIVRGDIGDYKRLSRFHYRDSDCGPVAAIYAIRPGIGVIIYTMPVLAAELRGAATGGMFSGLDRRTQMAVINKNIRCISRVIIEPRYRGLGLAVRLVRETMALLNVPIVEAMAVMGQVNPFFEKAGMTAYEGGTPLRSARLIEALSAVGIERDELHDTTDVHRRIEELDTARRDFIEPEIRRFLQSYGKSSVAKAGIERTRFVLSRLTHRPFYYIWFKEEHRIQQAE